MNKQFHRVIFNAARGMRMAVHEAASSCSGRGRLKATAAAAAAFAALAFTAQVSLAQIAGDPSAPASQRPVVVTAPNGTPLVNIQTPSAGGVSRNTYRQFDVNAQGAILNNSRTQTQTQQGGWVQGNPYLARGPARIIVNEVNSANPSQLRGYVEVAGQRAEVIIANPAGIQVNGGGFINASRATLTTGTPQFDNVGNLESFLVRGGTVSIDGAGLDARGTDYAAILARAVEVNAGIWANELKVVAGANQISADGGSATPTSGTGAAPAFALDVAQLGGMYAGKITLVGTEAGVGVRNAGHIGAGAGGLVVTADGRLENTATGTLASPRVELRSSSANIDNHGTIEAQSIELASSADIVNRGIIRQTGANSLTLQAPSLSNTQGGVIGAEPVAHPSPGDGAAPGTTPDSGSSNTGASGGASQGGAGTAGIGAAGGVAPQSPPAAAIVPGQIVAAGTIRNDGGRIYAGDVKLQTPNIDNSGGTLSVGELQVSGPRFSNAGGTLNVARRFDARVGSFNNAGGTLNTGSLQIATDSAVGNGALDNTAGALRSNGDLQLQVGGDLLNAGADISSAGTLNATVLGQVENTGGQMLANQQLALNAADLDNTGGIVGTGEGALDLRTQGQTRNVGGKLLAGGELRLQNVGLDNTSGQAVGQSVSVQSGNGALVNRQGLLGSRDGEVTVHSGALINDGGAIQASGALTIDTHGQQLSNRATSGDSLGISSTSTLMLNTGLLDNQNGFVGSSGRLRVTAQGVDNTFGGTVQSASDMHVDAGGGTYDNRGGKTLSGANLALTASKLDNSAGLIQALGQLDLLAGELNNANTLGAATPQAPVSSAAQDDQAPRHGIEGSRVAVEATTLNNGRGAIRASEDIRIASAGVVDNAGGLLIANELVAVNARGMGMDGTVASGGDVSIALQDDIRNTGELSAGRNLTLTTTGNIDNSGKLLAGGVLSVSGQDIDNAAGAEISAFTAQVTAGGTLTNRGLIDGATTRLQAATLNNVGTGRIYGDQVSIEAQTLNNLAQTIDGQTKSATIAARARLDIGAKEINNQGGSLIYSDGDLFVGAKLNAQGQAIESAATLNNRGSTIESSGNMAIAASVVNNISEGISWEVKPGDPTHVVQYSVPGDPRRYDASEVLFFSSRGRIFDTSDPRSPGNLDYTYLVIPAPEYPVAKFRPYYLSPPGRSVDYSYQVYHGGDAEWWETVNVAGKWYANADSIWTTFGVTPPAELPPTHIGRRYPGIVVGQTGVTQTYDGPSGPVETFVPFDHPVTQQEYDEWRAYRAAHAALDEQLQKFTSSYQGNSITGQPSRMHSTWDSFELTTTEGTAQGSVAAPARIVAGGNMNIALVAGQNVQGQILAGGTLNTYGATFANEPQKVDVTREVHGVVTRSWEQDAGSFGRDERQYAPTPYDTSETIKVNLAAGKVEGSQAVAPTRDIGTRTAGQAGGVDSGSFQGGQRLNPIAQVPNGAGAPLVVRTSAPNAGVPTASLFAVKASGTYLVETDPRFTNYHAWLSSDYLLANLGLDPLATQKRLGDGYYEQRLVREQVAYLSGYRFLDGFASDEDQYLALMNAGATFAQQYNLRPGVALTAEQMAQLTSDIVWLVEQTVTLPDGSTQQVLVPQVYVRVKAGDIDGSGALLSGNSVNMQLAGDALNGGTIAGREVVKIDAANIQNLGARISGGQVQLKAKEDINNIGGTIDAATQLSLEAGRDVLVHTTTVQGASTGGSGARLSTQSIDRIAGLYVTGQAGEFSVKAGQDVTLVGAQVQSAGSVSIDAGRDIHLGTVATGQELDVRWSENNTRQDSTRQSTGSTISAQGNATLSAGRDIDAEAAKLQAGETLALDAQGDITLQAAIDSQSASTYSKSGGGMNYFSLQASTSEQSLNRTELSAKDVVIKSGGDTTLSAITVNADTLDIEAGGKLALLAPKTQDSEGWNVTHGSSASVGAKGKGSSDEELNYNQFNIRGTTTINAQGGIQAQVGQDVNLNNLAQQPGMGWVSQITGDPKLTNSVEWQRVSQAHEQWSYRQSGMGPVSAALVAVMVAAAAAPAAGAAGTAAGGAATTATGSTLAGTVTAGAVKAGVLALSSQVGVSFFNNNGDLGKVFQELGSSDSVKNLAAAVITGGVLAGMGFQVLPDQPNVGSGAKLFGDQLINNLKIQGASTLINTAIKGGSLEDGLKDALLAALVNSVAATTANGIGDLSNGKDAVLNDFTNKVAHAIAGCTLGAAHSGNSGGCAGGAIGAAIGEMMAQAMGKSPGMDAFYSDQDKVYLAGLLGGLGAALAGGDAQQIATANWAGSNAAANNYLNHRQWGSFAKEMDQCQAKAGGCTAAEQRAIRERYHQLSAEQNVALANCDKTGNCAQLREEVVSGTGAMLNLIDRLPIGGASGNDLGQFAGQQLANDPGYRARVNESIAVINFCNTNPAACDQQALNAAALVITPLLPAAGVPLTLGRIAAGGTIGALGNAGGQLYANGGNLSDLKPTDAAVGAFTGALTYGAGFWSSLAVNSGGALVTSSLNGADSSSAGRSILGGAAGTTVGYPIGLAAERVANGYFNHWSRPMWKDLGLTVQKWIEPSPWPGAIGSALGGGGQELGNAAVNNPQPTNSPSRGSK